MGVALKIEGLCKAYGPKQVLREVDLQVSPGEVVCLLGPNGAGKSTLLRIIVGTVAADAGRVLVDGVDMRGSPPTARLRTAWVLGDEHGWYWRLSGLDNLVFFAMLRGLARETARRRARQGLEAHGLASDAATRVAEYSTGMRARLALARAGLTSAPLLVLDEPGRGLDAMANEHLERRLMGSDTGVLLVTHDLEMVSRVATRSVVLHRGEIRGEIGGGSSAAALTERLVALP